MHFYANLEAFLFVIRVFINYYIQKLKDCFLRLFFDLKINPE